MNLDRNICSVCGEKNFSDSEYNSEVQMCSDCFERKKNNETITLFSPDILEKDMFETTQEYQERVNNLGWLEVGEVTLNSYDADTEMFTISLSLNKALKKFVNIMALEMIIRIKKKNAKQLFSISNKHKLIAKIKFSNSDLKFKKMKFDQYFLNTQDNDFKRIWIDPVTTLMWEIKQSKYKKYDWNEAFEYAKELNTKNYGGFKDWRLPSVEDFKTILTNVKYKTNNTIKIKKSFLDDSYWTSSESRTLFWGSAIQFYSTDYCFVENHKQIKNSVRCVRGKQKLQ